LTATEAAWRRAPASHFAGGGIIVAIGYPLNRELYDMRRRTLDLSPPAGTPVTGHGGADIFLDFIQSSVRPAVKARFPQVAVSREALYGHSYGGLLALHALFTRPGSFDCYMASSPSIWWNNKVILQEAKAFLKTEPLVENLPSLMVFWGSVEQILISGIMNLWKNMNQEREWPRILEWLTMLSTSVGCYEVANSCILSWRMSSTGGTHKCDAVLNKSELDNVL
jgi:Predicted hydrolase of the alpha/beta superfamily